MNKKEYVKLTAKEKEIYKQGIYVGQVISLLETKLQEIDLTNEDYDITRFNNEWIEIVVFINEHAYLSYYYFYNYKKSISWVVSDILKELKLAPYETI